MAAHHEQAADRLHDEPPRRTELTMIDIRHRIGIDAPKARVHQALATTGGGATPFPGELQISSSG
jgi:hypothetical protein